MVVVPKDAATLVLMRESFRRRNEVEILMLRRNAKSVFLPGAYVFPGGSVEPADFAPAAEEFCRGLSFERACETLRGIEPPERALGFYVASIREVFEEAGILLAYRDTGELVSFDNEEEKGRFAAYRKRVFEDPSLFTSIMREERLILATDRLSYFAHWITPEVAPIRFDTRFFVAAAPSGQEAAFDTLETTDSKWVTPREIIEGRREGELSVVFPTFCNVKELAQYSSVAEVIASTVGKEVPTIQPLINMLQFG